MIDTETGYSDTLTCECKTCDHCQGDGYFYIDSIFVGEREVQLHKALESVCAECDGVGKFTGNCEIHDTDEADRRLDAIRRRPVTTAGLGDGQYVRIRRTA